MQRITSNELLNVLANQWASTNDIMKIGSVGKNTALKIKAEIKTNLKSEGYFLPKNLVPMESVIDYFKINVNYLKKVSNI